jgi:GTP-binding protein YchF
MGLSCGVIGLPNVGKSTLFNALTRTAMADAQNYPFCTIEPNTGRVAVPDKRLELLARMASSARVVPQDLTFTDIAGLVRGASRGEGLGNQFLGHVRETDALVHVVRCFDHEGIVHVEGSVDPVRDMETIETELVLADLESLVRRKPALEKKTKSDKTPAGAALLEAATRLAEHLNTNQPARSLVSSWDETLQQAALDLQLMTTKPVMYVCNVAEADAASGNAYTGAVAAHAARNHAPCLVISAAMEAELACLGDDEQRAWLESAGLAESGLAQVIRSGHALLGLLTFFTVGPQEARAWTVRKGSTAPQAAGVIHSDFERGFICAETMSFDDYVAFNGEPGCRSAGRCRQEGRHYLVQDGDIFHFRFNV